MDNIAQNTGELFGKLFTAFDQENFLKSVSLFEKRFKENNFDLDFFKGKNCLDLGCGGGRYSIALSRLGAEKVTGIDVSKTAIEDAQKRAASLEIKNTNFLHYDGTNLPFENNTFDCVIWSGVIMHSVDPILSMQEVSRVTKSGGMLYMLVYATEGLRWPLVNQLRNVTSLIPFEKMDEALTQAGLDVNKRRTYLDDLYVPLIDFYSFDRLKTLLQANNFDNIDRWKKGRLDHEENLEAYIKDLKGFELLFQTGCSSVNSFSEEERIILTEATNIITSIVNYCEKIHELNMSGKLSEREARSLVIGQGHHRIVCYKK
jgi:ubiquinone/menaquinone biosynthesis C-methylase UbiE